MPATPATSTTRRLREEVAVLVGPEVSERAIERAVRDAARDLHGSVSRESLPEMTAKLAVARLERMYRPPGADPTPWP